MMKGFCIFIVTLSIASAFVNFDQEWETFKEKFNKIYSPEEDAGRHKNFIENKVKIVDHNRRFEEGKETFKMGINQFADMSLEEFNQLMKTIRNTGVEKKETRRSNEQNDYPDTVDYRTSGCVTVVKDQGQCGTAWAFDVTEGIESVCCLKSGSFIGLSSQNLIDCVLGGSCNAASVTINDGYQYCVDNGGIDTAASYPEYPHGTCHFDPLGVACPCKGYENVPSGSEEDLLATVATIGPIATYIDASHVSFQLYASGVYYESACSSTILDHVVLIVGYGTEIGQDYWLVKNSWGTSWGENGYIKMSRNRDNNCGIATNASYPLL